MKNLMETPHEVPNNIHYAGFAKRLKAFAFDTLIIFAYNVVLAGVNYGIILSGGALEEISLFFASPLVKDSIAFLTLLARHSVFHLAREFTLAGDLGQTAGGASGGQREWGDLD